MTGGRLYGHSLEKIIPNFAQEAPIERKITKEKISLMASDGSVDIGFRSNKLSSENDTCSYTVLRAPFDQWLASKAEEAGASIGTCRVLSFGKIVKQWKHPEGGIGISYRRG